MWARGALGCMLWMFLHLVPGTGWAEWFLDVYGGGGFIDSNDVSVKKSLNPSELEKIGFPSNFGTLRLRATLRDVRANDFATGGLRFGYWLESVPYVGFALDAFLFDLSVPRQTVIVDANASLDVTIEDETFPLEEGIRLPGRLPAVSFPTTAITSSPSVMLRWPTLVSADFPKGRLQPYFTVGPALLFTDTDPEASLGVKVGTGLAWQVHRHFALFVEYRFTHFNPEVETGSVTLFGFGFRVRIRDPKIETDLNTHYVTAGISFRF
ncbi:MAG: porin family protein [Candidatus Binatia bacterium]|nr:porin family protein [Candidatus Binatia bacterium]